MGQDLGEMGRTDGYCLPDWDLLADPDPAYGERQEKSVREQAAKLDGALREFNVRVDVVEIDAGPLTTLFELALGPGVKVSQISELRENIGRVMSARSVRVISPVPGKSTVGIEVPSLDREAVRLKDVMQAKSRVWPGMQVPIFLGKDASGVPLAVDLAGLGHCLIVGSRGQGVEMCVNSILLSILYAVRPERVKLILLDPKEIDLSPFKDVPHLMCPFVHDAGQAIGVLKWLVGRVQERRELLVKAGVRNVAEYNGLPEQARIAGRLPYIVVVVNEYSELMREEPGDVEALLVRLLESAGPAGVHLVLATQRPVGSVVTGPIKRSAPTRITFRVPSRLLSCVVMERDGAEELRGHGDMLLLPPTLFKPIRVQGTYVDDKEIVASLKLVKALAQPRYHPELVRIAGGVDEEKDELLGDAVGIVMENLRGLAELLQRKLEIDADRAKWLLKIMAVKGLLGDPEKGGRSG